MNYLIESLELRVKSFKDWKEEVNEIIYGKEEKKYTIKMVQNLIKEGEEKGFSVNCNAFKNLKQFWDDIKQLLKVTKELLSVQAKHEEEENQKKIKSEACVIPIPTSARIKKKLENEKEESFVPNSLKPKSNASKVTNFEDVINCRLSLEDYASLCEELEKNSIIIPELDLMKSILSKCEAIYELIKKYSKCEDKTSYSKHQLESIISDASNFAFINFGENFNLIKYKLDEMKWFEECGPLLQKEDTHQASESNVTLTSLKALIEKGMHLLLPSMEIRNAVIQLNQILEDANNWLETAKYILSLCKPGESENGQGDHVKRSLKTFQDLIKERDTSFNLKCINLNPFYQQIVDITEEARKWNEKAESVLTTIRYKAGQSDENIPTVQVIEDLIQKGNSIGCQLENMSHLNSTLTTVNSWKDKLSKAFVRKNSLYRLVNVLSPRNSNSLFSSFDLVNSSSRILYQHLKKLSSQTLNKDSARRLSWFDRQLNGEVNRDKINLIYKKAEEDEKNVMRLIRKRNVSKNNKMKTCDNCNGDEEMNGNGSKFQKEKEKAIKRFCVCGKPVGDWMIQCQLCQEWFHLNCVQSLVPGRGRKQGQSVFVDEIKHQQNFVCILCSKGKRPGLESVNHLLTSFYKLPVRLFEGELLKCLMERVVNYQQKLKKELAERSDLQKAYDLVVSNTSNSFQLMPNLMTYSQDSNLQDSPSKNKRKSTLISRGK